MTYRIITLLALTTATPALAQSAQSTAGLADASQSGDAIVVTAGRTAQPISQVGQSITVFDARTIATRQAVSPLDLLRQTPGVTITQDGGFGTQAGVSIRGADTDQTVALIDGIKITDPSSPGNSFDFSTLLIGNIDRIEVLRGPASVLWGSQAIGGVVNMITRQPTDTLAINARAEGGSYGTGQGVANVSDKFGPLAMSVGGGYFRTDGISAFDRALGGTERDGDRNAAANASINLALADTVSIDLRGFYSHNHVDIDGFVLKPDGSFGLGDDREYQINREFVGYAGLNVALLDGHFHNRFGFAFTDNRNRDFNPDDAPFDTLTFLGKGRTERAEYQGDLDIADGIRAVFGAEHEYARYFANDGFGDLTHGRETTDSGYAQVLVTPLKGLTATGGVRYDRHSQFGGRTIAAGSLVYSPNDGLTTFRGSYTEGYKAPSLFQLYSNYGNTALRPETSQGWDAGITQRSRDGRFEASATYFERHTSNLIDFVDCLDQTGICTDRPFGTYDNVDRARARGVELTAAVKPVDAFAVSANYTYLDARDRSPGSPDFNLRLPRRPANSVTVNADYRWSFGLAAGATLTHVSSSYDQDGELHRLQGYVLTGLRVSYPLAEHWEVYGRVDNLFDVHYETAYQYGQLGRAIYGGVRLKI